MASLSGLGSRDTTLGHRIEIASDELPPTRSATVISRRLGLRVDTAEPQAILAGDLPVVRPPWSPVVNDASEQTLGPRPVASLGWRSCADRDKILAARQQENVLPVVICRHATR